MAFNGSGVFSRLYNWATEQLSSPIEISKLDLQEEDIATALSNCILRDGTGVPTAATPWNSQKITGLGNAAADTDALNRITADGRFGQRIWAVKAADTGRTTTTYADDPDLSLTLAVGTYIFDMVILAQDGNGTAGGAQIKWQFANTAVFSNGSRIRLQYGVSSLTDAGMSSFATNLAGTSGAAAASPKAFLVSGLAVVGTAGNLRFQWAAVAAAGTSTVMAGSYMNAVKIA